MKRKPILKAQIVALSLQLVSLQTDKANGRMETHADPDKQDTANCIHPAVPHQWK